MSVLYWLLEPSHWIGPAGVPSRVFEHLQLTVSSVLIASVIALPVGVAIGHWRRAEWLVALVAAGGRAVPTFALLLLFASIGTIGVGTPAAVAALVVFAIPPVLVNAHVGIRGVPHDVVVAARAMGLAPLQVIRVVELPLAAPLILAGLRTTFVQTAATATLAAFVGGGGLGRFIIDGFALQNTPMVLSGVVLVSVLTVSTEALLALVDRTGTRRMPSPPSQLRPTVAQ
jgi:osmoprotectant transport system permease protein